MTTKKKTVNLEAIGTIMVISSIFLIFASPAVGVACGMLGLVVFVVGRFQ